MTVIYEFCYEMSQSNSNTTYPLSSNGTSEEEKISLEYYFQHRGRLQPQDIKDVKSMEIKTADQLKMTSEIITGNNYNKPVRSRGKKFDFNAILWPVLVGAAKNGDRTVTILFDNDKFTKDIFIDNSYYLIEWLDNKIKDGRTYIKYKMVYGKSPARDIYIDLASPEDNYAIQILQHIGIEFFW
jgi:hypothetical protein